MKKTAPPAYLKGSKGSALPEENGGWRAIHEEKMHELLLRVLRCRLRHVFDMLARKRKSDRATAGQAGASGYANHRECNSKVGTSETMNISFLLRSFFGAHSRSWTNTPQPAHSRLQNFAALTRSAAALLTLRFAAGA